MLLLIACATTQISLSTFKVSQELSCTDTYIHVDKWYTLQVYLDRRRDLILTPVAHLRKRLSYRLWGSCRWWLGVGRGKCASLYTGTQGAGFEIDWCNFGGVSVDTTILHTFLSMYCMYRYGILEGTRAWRYNCRDGKGDTAPENFGIYSFIEHDRFDLFTSEGQIRAVMYMPCVKCSCSEHKLAKHLHTFFVLT